MSQLVVRVIDDIKPFVGDKAFSAQIQKNVSILGDEALLEEALWALLTAAYSLSTNRSPVNVSFATEEWRAILIVNIDADGASVPEMEELKEPFRTIEHKDGGSLRFRDWSLPLPRDCPHSQRTLARPADNPAP